jgi:hypothetical protein
MEQEKSVSCFLFHRWSKWEQFTWDGLVKYGGKWHRCTERRQRRHCLRCGYAQSRPVNGD